MIDKQSILEQADLLTLAEHDSQLRRVASTGGGEFAGPCPFCGGRDRFRVQPYKSPWGLWMCRQCTGGKWQNAIDYVITRDNCDFKRACEILTGGELPTTRRRPAPPDLPAYDPPAGDWQAQALQALRVCHDNLYREISDKAIDYLLSRGLAEPTWRRFFLGFSPGAKFGDLYIPRGITIPCLSGGEVWYIKICLLPGDPVRCEKCGDRAQARQPCPSCGKVNKYRGVKGNRTAAIYNADDLAGAEIALFVEGEFDCITAWQELQGVNIAVATLGAASNRLDLATWGAYLLGLQTILTTYDSDQAGQAGADYLAGLMDRAQPCPLPDGVKDISDYYLAGADLLPWLESNLDRLGIMPAELAR